MEITYIVVVPKTTSATGMVNTWSNFVLYPLGYVGNTGEKSVVNELIELDEVDEENDEFAFEEFEDGDKEETCVDDEIVDKMMAEGEVFEVKVEEYEAVVVDDEDVVEGVVDVVVEKDEEGDEDVVVDVEGVVEVDDEGGIFD